MATFGLTTGLDSTEVVHRAVAFFGVEGIGLEVVLRGDCCVRFAGGDGHVQVTTWEASGETVVELQTVGWDGQMREFIRSLPRSANEKSLKRQGAAPHRDRQEREEPLQKPPAEPSSGPSTCPVH